MKFSSILATSSLLAVAALSTTASAAPAWCKDARFDRPVTEDDLASQEPRQIVEALASATCAPNERVAGQAAAIEQGRRAWGKRLGMEDADWADVIAWVAANEGRDTKMEYASKDATTFSPIDQYVAITTSFHDKGGAKFRDWMYTADAFDPQLTEVGRFGAIKACLREADEHFKIVPFALCQADLDALDLGKFNAQLHADTTHPGDRKMELRFAMLDASARLAQQPAKVAAAMKEDPAYKQMFDLAAKARAEWAAGIGKDKELLALVLKMDSALWSESRSQHEGCEAATSAALATAAGKLPAAAFKGLKDKREDPTGGFAAGAAPLIAASPELNLAAVAYLECHPDGGTGNLLASALAWNVDTRGPRSMALARILGAKLALDDASATIRWPDVLRSFGGRVTAASAGAVIASTKLEGDLAIVTPVEMKVKRLQCVKSHDTNKISRIRHDGVLEYASICDEEKLVEVDIRWAPFKVKKAFAPLLAKGGAFSASYGSESAADVLAVWSNPKSEAPSWFLGAKVK